MHIVEVLAPSPFVARVGRYLAEDINSADMLARGGCTLQSATFEGVGKKFDPSQDWNRKRILFVRPGGFGDLLFLTPTFAEIRRRWPDCEIWVACFKRYHEALLHNPDVAGFIDYPVSETKWTEFSAQIWLENLLECNREAETVHAVDLAAKRAGIELTDKRMRYVVTDDERLKAVDEFPRIDQRRIGIQVSAGARCRTWPFTANLAKRLWRDGGHEVFLFGAPGEMPTDEPEGLVNLTQRNKSFRESCAILATCDVIVGPDSALVHVAGALDLPCVAIYGPFPWKLRTAYADKTFALQGVCPISPCFHHVRPGLHVFPENGPCNDTGRCEALAMITVDRVIREVEKRFSV